MVPFDFYVLAQRLIENEKNSEGYRTSISRAYYAAFHVASRFLHEIGASVPRGTNSHERVPAILAGTQDSEIVKAGAKLAELRDERNTADYDLDDHDVEEESYALLRLATAADIMGAINTCRSARGNERYSKVALATKNWARTLSEGPSKEQS